MINEKWFTSFNQLKWNQQQQKIHKMQYFWRMVYILNNLNICSWSCNTDWSSDALFSIFIFRFLFFQTMELNSCFVTCFQKYFIKTLWRLKSISKCNMFPWSKSVITLVFIWAAVLCLRHVSDGKPQDGCYSTQLIQLCGDKSHCFKV